MPVVGMRVQYDSVILHSQVTPDYLCPFNGRSCKCLLPLSMPREILQMLKEQGIRDRAQQWYHENDGARRKIEKYSAEDAETMVLPIDESTYKLKIDATFHVIHASHSKSFDRHFTFLYNPHFFEAKEMFTETHACSKCKGNVMLENMGQLIEVKHQEVTGIFINIWTENGRIWSTAQERKEKNMREISFENELTCTTNEAPEKCTSIIADLHRVYKNMQEISFCE
ncbi:Uncharacterized protein Fot_25464 [Forsythia ovata]|uniref:Uncharacterized protein n=1 Tax=Forsythia ovata TaxID=205694 RepID=A0ABD1U990_9LAMI